MLNEIRTSLMNSSSWITFIYTTIDNVQARIDLNSSMNEVTEQNGCKTFSIFSRSSVKLSSANLQLKLKLIYDYIFCSSVFLLCDMYGLFHRRTWSQKNHCKCNRLLQCYSLSLLYCTFLQLFLFAVRNEKIVSWISGTYYSDAFSFSCISSVVTSVSCSMRESHRRLHLVVDILRIFIYLMSCTCPCCWW